MQRWTVHLEGGPRRVNHAAVAIGDKIYSFGGYCSGEDYENTRPMDVHILDTISYRWKLLPLPKKDDIQYNCTPYQRYGHTAVAYNECAYIWGGRQDRDGVCNVLFCFDTVALKWSRVRVSGIIPGARDGHSACVIKDCMYIFGGYEEEVDKFSNDVHKLDLVTMTWSLLKTKGTPARWRDFHSASGIGDTMYIFGGRSDKGGPFHTNNEIYCNKIQLFNTVTQTWHEPLTTGAPPAGRRSHSAFVYKGQLYGFGGYNGLHDLHFGDIFKFDPVTMHWSPLKVEGKGPCARRRQFCCLVGDRVFLFGGTSPCPHPLSTGLDFELMDHSDFYVLDFALSLKTLCMLTVLNSKLDTTNLPRMIRWELAAMTTNSTISRPYNTCG